MAVPTTAYYRPKAAKAVSDVEHSTTSQSDDDSSVTSHGEEDNEIFSDAEELDSETTRDNGLANISFGALAKAQESLNQSAYKEDGTHSTSANGIQEFDNAEAIERRAGKSNNREHIRSSKHAPAEMSSKKAVSRKREVVQTVERDIRDPRFEPVTGPVNEEKANRNYSFLNDYRDSEMDDLKSQIRQTKDATAKEKLKRSLLSMESRKKAQQMKDQESEVQRAHRAKEKELVKQGKKPFYLKKGEQKKLALIKRFEGIKGKRLDKVIERRRKKNAQKERRDMPERRRTANG
ncbi:MAG: hypothetical protein Q9209_002238 [Squamulea sp. 1 TL-2023]